MFVNPKTEIITWSRYHLSLLCSFQYKVKRNGNRLMILRKDKDDNYDYVATISKEQIVQFLIEQGHNIKLNNSMQKSVMDFDYKDKPIQYYRE